MADISTAAVGASSTPNIQPISEQDFAQIKPVATKQSVDACRGKKAEGTGTATPFATRHST